MRGQSSCMTRFTLREDTSKAHTDRPETWCGAKGGDRFGTWVFRSISHSTYLGFFYLT